MQTNIGHERMWPAHPDRPQTRDKGNRNWSRRGDNTKYKVKK